MPELSNLRGLAGEAGPSVSAVRATVMAHVTASLFAEAGRRMADELAHALAATRAPTADPAERLGPHHRVERAPCRN